VSLLGIERPASRVLAPSSVPTGMIAAILIGPRRPANSRTSRARRHDRDRP
jgi:hypothetical protein